MKAWSCLLFLPCATLAADLPAPVLPEGVGVNIHFTTGHAKDLDLIAAGGFKFIRMDFHWSGIERKRGEYNWSEYDELTANLEQRGLRAIYILDYSNPLYEDTITITNRHTQKLEKVVISPQHPASIAAFARWAGAAAAHFRGRPIVWEIWNEPNIGFWQPQPDAAQYTALTLATVKAVRAADPQATIIAPGSSQFPWPFFETLFASGILKNLDGVSVHPYRNGPPETAAADFLKLRALIAQYAPPAKRNLPIISSEWGYSTQHQGTPLALQAAYLPRQQLANLLTGVPLSIWYDWKNDGSDTNYNEHNFGTVTTNLQPKPSYHAVQTLTRELAGYHIVRRLKTANTNDWILLCVNAHGKQKLAGWTLDVPHTVRIPLAAKPLELELSAAPQYGAIEPSDPQLAWVAAWQATARDILISSVNGGKAVIRVEAQNPEPTPLTAQFICDGFDSGPKELTLELPPHGQASGELVGSFARRDREMLTAHVCALFHSKNSGGDREAALATAQSVDFVCADPLRLTLMPFADGLCAVIENPSRTVFRGKLQFGNAKEAVALATSAEHGKIALPKNTAAKATLIDDHGTVVAESAVPRMTAVEIPTFRAVLDGDKKVPGKATISSTAAPGPEAPCTNAFRLDYEFESGWRFARCAPDVKPRVALPGRPQAFGLWIFGDKSGNRINARLTDESGQTFQIDGPALDWQGWQWVLFPVGELQHASHWGGANDGKIHGTLRWDCPLLVDSQHRNTTGAIFFAGLTLCYDYE